MIALQSFLDNLRGFLGEGITTSQPTVGTVLPHAAEEIPAVTLSMSQLDCATVGVGGSPGKMVQGVMPVSLTLDLANPVITFPGNETVNLLSEDRMNLQIPHHPLVDNDGSSPEYLQQSDVSVTVDAVDLAVTQTEPESGQCRLSGTTGVMELGTPLGVSGELIVFYRIGQWETQITRCSGLLQVDVFGQDTTATESLSNEVAALLSQNLQEIMNGLTRLSPVTWGAIEKPAVPKGNTMRRTLCYSFNFDHEQSVLGTGGGPIRVIDVSSEMGPEQFLIKKEE